MISNFSVFAAMAGISIVSKWSVDGYNGSIQQAINASPKVRAVALFIFTALGFPLAVSTTLLHLPVIFDSLSSFSSLKNKHHHHLLLHLVCRFSSAFPSPSQHS